MEIEELTAVSLMLSMRNIIFDTLLLSAGLAVSCLAKASPDVGDANGDGAVDIADGVAIVSYVVGMPAASFLPENADIDGDGSIDIADAVAIVNIITGQSAPADTIKVCYGPDGAVVSGSFSAKRILPSVNGADVKIVSTGKRPFVCEAEGESTDGSLTIDADTCSTLVLDNLILTSNTSAAVSFPQKQKVTIEVPGDSHTVLTDATTRDDGDGGNACLHARGSLNFCGKGSLTVAGRYGHAIASSKDIAIEGCTLTIADAVKNGLHCDKFLLKKGRIDLHMQHNASKGIKAKEELAIKGGTIEGEATGDLTDNHGDLSYCTLLKSDGTMTLSDGTLTLQNSGKGGRCISVDKDLIITGGIMTLTCQGDGGTYINTQGEQDYYTPKCITVDGASHIERGQLHLLATGNGGKGLDCSGLLFIGRKGDDFVSEDSLLITVETCGTALVDNIEEDYRKGCPKAIKSDDDLTLYSGTLHLETHGQGGEGIECKQTLKAYRCAIMCDTYDDGINTGHNCHINGAIIHCLSHHNDGIDSNGKISILDGIVAAISEDGLNECFDTAKGCMYIYGGLVMGIGNNSVLVGQQSTALYYSTQLHMDEHGNQYGDNISISSGNFLTVAKGGEAIMSLFHDYANSDAFVVVSSPQLQSGRAYDLIDGAKPVRSKSAWMDGKMLIGGNVENQRTIYTIKL